MSTISAKKILFFFCSIAISLFIINRAFFFSNGFLENTATKLTYPFLFVSSKIADYFENKFQKKEEYKQLLAKYEKLEQKFEEALDEIIQTKAMLRYDQLSQDLKDFQKRYNASTMLLAKILVKNLSKEEHYFLVNKGNQNGIKKDMVALYKQQLIGRVSEVFDYYCKIILITDKNCNVSAYSSNTNANGIVRGYNDQNRCKFAYVSHLSNVEDNEIIISSGQGLVFPGGFCLGRIISHSLQPKALYHDIEIEPFIKLETLQFCLLTDNAKINLTSTQHQDADLNLSCTVFDQQLNLGSMPPKD